MHPLIEKLLAGKVVITDGAMGTQLQAAGLAINACPDEWNLSNPAQVENVARAYVAAGSQIVLTNTFGANRFVLGRHGLADDVGRINRAGAELAARAAAGRAEVFGSIGPTGIMLLMGEVSDRELHVAMAEQARALAEGGASGLVIETMSDLAEARLAVAAAAETGLAVVACMVFGSGKDHDRTIMGTAPEQAAAELLSAGADIVGSNCGQGIEGFLPLCRRLRVASGRPVWIKANAGLPEVVEGRAVYVQTPQQFAGHVPALLDAGAGFVGGCCGTTPEFIHAIRATLDGVTR
jgi:methionine synthase I (cobalamin-dependent)